MVKRELKNNPRMATNVTKRGTKEQRTRAAKKAKIRIASLALALGMSVAAPTVIGQIANKVNHANSTKEAIEMAASSQEYLNSISNDPVMQAVINQEDTIKLENLVTAISTYKQLKYKTDKTTSELQQYLDACRTICDSRTLVIELYTDVIKEKTAEAYGITNIKDIEAIQVKDHVDIRNGIGHNPVIVLQDGTTINNNGSFLNSQNTMDKTLANAIIQARALRDEGRSFDESKLEDLPIDQIITTFEEAKQFQSTYQISVNKNGDLETSKIEQVQEEER